MPGIFPALGKRLVFSRLAGLHAGYFSPRVRGYKSLVLLRMTGLHGEHFSRPWYAVTCR